MQKSKLIARELLPRLAPIVFLFWFYRLGLKAWFQQDDFAWLQMRRTLHTASDWMFALFTPLAQGTVRPISERLFFIWGTEFFFLDPRPMHLLVALTQTANVLLLFSLTFRLIGSRVGAMLACIAWLCSAGMATPMSWLSTYNQILISFVFLAGLTSFIRAEETGRKRWMAASWTVFLLGFGVLEINVVLPGILTAWVLIYRREAWRRVIPFWAVSVCYAVAHAVWAAKPSTGVYARHWDLSVFSTYIRYWKVALGGGQVPPGWNWPDAAWLWVAGGCAAAMAGVLLWNRRADGARAGLFGALWFSCVLGPVLPLRDHFSDYYLASAFPGISLLIASFALHAWRMGPAGRVALVLTLAAHLSVNASLNDAVTRWRFERGQRIRVLVEGLERAVQLHPGKTIFVAGLDRDLFWSCFYDKPFVLFGVRRMYLMPGEEQEVGEAPEIGSLAAYVAPKPLVVRALEGESGVVYRFEGTALRNITKRTRTGLPPEWRSLRPSFIDVGQPEWSRELEDGWHPVEGGGIRWMKQQASLKLGIPEGGARVLFLEGHCPEDKLNRPQVISVTIGSVPVGELPIKEGSGAFEGEFTVPQEALKGGEVTVTIRAARRLEIPGDGRELAAVFGRIGFR